MKALKTVGAIVAVAFLAFLALGVYENAHSPQAEKNAQTTAAVNDMNNPHSVGYGDAKAACDAVATLYGSNRGWALATIQTRASSAAEENPNSWQNLATAAQNLSSGADISTFQFECQTDLPKEGY